MEKCVCRRCGHKVRGPVPQECPTCGLGAPDLQRPVAVSLTVLVDAVMIAFLFAIAAASLLVALDVPTVSSDEALAVADALQSAWVPFGIALAFGTYLLFAAIGVRAGRRWGRRMQDTLAWLWMVAGINILIFNALRPPASTEGLAVTPAAVFWLLGTGFVLLGFLWTAFLTRPRPRQWFRTMHAYGA